MNAHTRVTMGIEEFTAASLQAEWTVPRFDLAQSARVVTTPEGRIVAYGSVWDNAELLLRAYADGFVHPDFEGQGIGTLLLEWAEARARQSVDRVPDGARYILQTDCVSTYDPARRLLEGFGMEHIRTFWEMRIDLSGDIPAPAWPEGIIVRPINPATEARAYIAAFREAFRDHWGFTDEPLDKVMEHWQHRMDTEPDYDPSLWFAAFDGSEIAGVALCWPKADGEPEVGWINILGVRRPWRKRGLAEALLRHAFREFQARGRTCAGLGVDSSNLTGATRLYEKAGMRVHRRFDSYAKELRPGADLLTPSVSD
jgi:mycothiol synthase